MMVYSYPQQTSECTSTINELIKVRPHFRSCLLHVWVSDVAKDFAIPLELRSPWILSQFVIWLSGMPNLTRQKVSTTGAAVAGFHLACKLHPNHTHVECVIVKFCMTTTLEGNQTMPFAGNVKLMTSGENLSFTAKKATQSGPNGSVQLEKEFGQFGHQKIQENLKNQHSYPVLSKVVNMSW